MYNYSKKTCNDNAACIMIIIIIMNAENVSKGFNNTYGSKYIIKII